MPRPIISARDLIVASWTQFLQDWKQTLEISIYFLGAAVLVFIGALLSRAITQPAWSEFVAGVFNVAGFLFTLSVALRLEQFILHKDRVRTTLPKDIKPVTKKLLLSFIFIAILELLAVVGGSFVFILPGIWLAVALMFSRYAFLEDGTRGMQALTASFALVKGRWWNVFWRTLASGLVFTPLVVIGLLGITIVVSLIAGADKASLLLNASDPSVIDPMQEAVRFLLQAIIQAVLLPLFVTWQVKLFHSLKDTR